MEQTWNVGDVGVSNGREVTRTNWHLNSPEIGVTQSNADRVNILSRQQSESFTDAYLDSRIFISTSSVTDAGEVNQAASHFSQ